MVYGRMNKAKEKIINELECRNEKIQQKNMSRNDG